MNNHILYSLGKSKILYRTDNPHQLIMKFIDSVHGGGRVEMIPGTGVLRAEICVIFYLQLEKNGIKTHFIKKIGPGQLLVKKLSMFRLEIVPRNFAAGSLVKNYPYNLGERLSPSLIHFHLKLGKDPVLTDGLITGLGLANHEELSAMKQLAQKVNSVLSEFLKKRRIILADFKFEAGNDTEGNLTVGDEISSDSGRFWDAKTLTSNDKDLFRYQTGNVKEAYKKLLKKISAPIKS